MISSASNNQSAHHVHGVSSAGATSSASATSSATSVNSARSTSADVLEEDRNGFKNAWLSQLDQEKRVQNTGAAHESQRVENAKQTQHTQTVADMLSQERHKKV